MVYHILIGKPIVNNNSIGKPKKLKKEKIFFIFYHIKRIKDKQNPAYLAGKNPKLER